MKCRELESTPSLDNIKKKLWFVCCEVGERYPWSPLRKLRQWCRRELTEGLFIAEAPRNVGQDAAVDHGAQMRQCERRIGEPQWIHPGRGRIFCSDQLVVKPNIRIKLIRRSRIRFGELIHERGVGTQVLVIVTDGDEIGQGRAA